MVMTFDFINYARKDSTFMKKLKDCLVSNDDAEMCTDICRLLFDGKRRVVRIEAISDTSPFHNKIIPALISYEALNAVLHGDWDALENGFEWL